MSSNINNHIRRLRFETGDVTQETLARQCGVTRQTIIALEAGKYTPSLELAFKLANAFGVGIDQVFEWQAPPPTAARRKAKAAVGDGVS